jgi:hypothetical protein
MLTPPPAPAPSRSHRRVLVGALVLVGAVVSLTAPGVGAAPAALSRPAATGDGDVAAALADPARQDQVQQIPGDRWLIPFRATEVGAALRLSGETNETVVNLPVIDGTTPQSIDAQLTVSPDVDSGYLEYQGPGVPSRLVDFATLGGRPQDAPVTLDLRGMTATNGQLKLTIRTRLRSTDPSCVTSLLGAWAELRNGGIVLSGNETPPAAVSTYLPSLLQRLEVYVPPEPTAGESAAALRIAMAAVRTAIGRNPQVEVLPLANADGVPDVGYGTGIRQVAVSTSLPPGARLVSTPAGGTVLSLGGPTEDLDRTSRALTSNLAGLATGADVQVQGYDPTGQDGVVPKGLPPAETPEEGSSTTTSLAPDADPADPALRDSQFTLADLTVGTKRVTGLGRLELPIRLDQTVLGGPTQKVDLHLEGTLTPIAKGADATMSLLVDSTLVQSRNLAGFTGDENADGVKAPGHFQIDATVPADQLKRSLEVTLVVDYSPPGGECRPGDVPFMMQLDPANSRISVEPGQGLSPGFQRFPQVLLPTFRIGLDEYRIDRLGLSFRLALALQRVATAPLDPSFTSVDKAVGADGAALIVSKWTPGLLKAAPLLSADPYSVTNDQRIEKLRLAVDQPHAVLEAFQHEGNDRLMLTWSDGRDGGAAAGIAQADLLLDGIATREQDFSGLFGDTYLVSTGAPPLSISVRGEDVQSTPVRQSPNYLQRAKPLLLAAVGVGIVVAVMAWIRRRRRTGADADADAGADADADADADS